MMVKLLLLWPVEYLYSLLWSAIRSLSVLRYPHVVEFRFLVIDDVGDQERYRWIRENVSGYRWNVWVDLDRIALRHDNKKVTIWVHGWFRFRKEEDAVLFKLRWT